MARKLAEVIGADLHDIEPVQKYTKEDLNWNNVNSRSSVEMKNKNFRPEIKSKVNNIEEYDIVYVGFPIWWYVAPTIINTFLEKYDLTDKVIIPFAASGGSNMGNTNEELKKANCRF
ncbi:NAD(P)H-dependent oxidoreductase [Fusobacterium animalis]